MGRDLYAGRDSESVTAMQAVTGFDNRGGRPYPVISVSAHSRRLRVRAVRGDSIRLPSGLRHPLPSPLPGRFD